MERSLPDRAWESILKRKERMTERRDTSVHRKQRIAKPDTLNGQEGPQLLAAGREMPVPLHVFMWVCACLQVHVSIHDCGGQRPILSIILQCHPPFLESVCHWPGASRLDRMAPGIGISPPP